MLTNRQKETGFTLIECLIVLLIITIFTVFALPAYLESVAKTKRTDGINAVMEANIRQERFFTENAQYTLDVNEIGGASSVDGYYQISVNNSPCADSTCFTLTATPINDLADDDCGAFTLTSVGRKGLINAERSTDYCWRR